MLPLVPFFPNFGVLSSFRRSGQLISISTYKCRFLGDRLFLLLLLLLRHNNKGNIEDFYVIDNPFDSIPRDIVKSTLGKQRVSKGLVESVLEYRKVQN